MGLIGEWEVVDNGVKRMIHQPGKQLMMMEVQFEQGGIGAEHSHPHEQYTYCLAGEFQFKVDGKEIILKKGESLNIQGGAIHGVVAIRAGSLLDIFTPLREDLLNN